MPTLLSPTDNRLLAKLPGASVARLLPHFELIPLLCGEALLVYGAGQEYVYFPVTAVVTLHHALASGALSEVSLVGNEGVIGIPLLLNGDVTPCRAVVRTTGHAYRMSARILTQELNRAGPELRLLLAYARALVAQMERSASCREHGTIERSACAHCANAPACPSADN
ncbi:hypothetical protein [Janthinobacterium sp.]|uniref:hypothetical protein n=1 Tax=Janthinobacterium sp. TaxID=1871054 RepID=UPI00293D7E6B|nr:hypothetical protein [Janthinobacterium sp.]